MNIGLMPYGKNAYHRLLAPYSALNHRVRLIASASPSDPIWDHDLYVISNPTDVEMIYESKSRGKMLIVDIDRCYWEDHEETLYAACDHADVVTVSSPMIAEFISKHASRVTYIPPAINTEELALKEGFAFRSRYKKRRDAIMGVGTTILIYAADVFSADMIRDQMDSLIENFSADIIVMCPEDPRFPCSKPNRIAWQKMPSERERMKYVALADIVVMPVPDSGRYTYQDFCPLLEAGVYGVPLITSQFPAIENFEIEGECLTFDPQNLTVKLKEVLDSEETYIEERQRHHNAVIEHYTMEKVNQLRIETISKLQ